MAKSIDTDDKTITKDEFTKLLKRCKSLESTLADARGDIGNLVAKACDEKNLHKAAFGLVRRCTRMDPVKLYAFLQALDAYREHAELDDRAGESLELGDAPPKRGRGRPRKVPIAEPFPAGGNVARMERPQAAASPAA